MGGTASAARRSSHRAGLGAGPARACVPLIMTLCAGRFTPQASVAVDTSTCAVAPPAVSAPHRQLPVHRAPPPAGLPSLWPCCAPQPHRAARGIDRRPRSGRAGLAARRDAASAAPIPHAPHAHERPSHAPGVPCPNLNSMGGRPRPARLHMPVREQVLHERAVGARHARVVHGKAEGQQVLERAVQAALRLGLQHLAARRRLLRAAAAPERWAGALSAGTEDGDRLAGTQLPLHRTLWAYIHAGWMTQWRRRRAAMYIGALWPGTWAALPGGPQCHL